jgi:hypothetical protein
MAVADPKLLLYSVEFPNFVQDDPTCLGRWYFWKQATLFKALLTKML